MKTVTLKLVCAIALAGEVLRAGALVEVTESEAKDLLQRGKAELIEGQADADDAALDADNTAATIEAAPAAAAEIAAGGGVDTAATIANTTTAKPEKAGKTAGR